MYSMDIWARLEHLGKVTQAQIKAGIKIQPKKTKIFQDKTEQSG